MTARNPRTFSAIAAAIAAVTLALAATPAAAAPTAAVRDQLLAAHNVERDRLGLPPLTWNPDLAGHAQAWADHLVSLGALQHSANETRTGEGENLWMGTAGYYNPTAMVGSWADERADFTYGVFPDVGADWHKVGHYTQMVWRNTTQVGCAIATGGGWDYLVCRYSPPGNYMGEKPY
ncbi:MAG: Cysteine-rich secretory protein family protein [Caulobacter sp.]|nr:Cysteine-rich secretory protein family protein [Caulobacter sp.]